MAILNAYRLVVNSQGSTEQVVKTAPGAHHAWEEALFAESVDHRVHPESVDEQKIMICPCSGSALEL